jgi:hypothetical protein
MRYTRIGAIADDKRHSIVGESGGGDKNAEEQGREKGK